MKQDNSRRNGLALLGIVIVAAGLISLTRPASDRKVVEVKQPAAAHQPSDVAKKSEAAVDFGPFMARLQKQIKGEWSPPKGEETRSGKVTFKVCRDGSMQNLRITKSTDLPAADAAMIAAMKNAAPFEQLPEGAPESVDVEFSFDYNVYKSGDHHTLEKH